MWKAFTVGLALAAAPLGPLAAQTGDPHGSITAEDALAKERQVYGVPKPPPEPSQGCDTGQGANSGDIVVCARKPGDSAQFRVKSTAELDPKSRQNLYDGLPRGPDISGLPDCSSGCMRMGRNPPPIHLIDLSKIPEAPEGSDADRIAKGEKAAS
jgi:hypothetical protein